MQLENTDYSRLVRQIMDAFFEIFGKDMVLCRRIELEKVLEKNDFNFYLYKNGKVYRKNADGVKRIKDMRELESGK